jgi:hypothetical protein
MIRVEKFAIYTSRFNFDERLSYPCSLSFSYEFNNLINCFIISSFRRSRKVTFLYFTRQLNDDHEDDEGTRFRGGSSSRNKHQSHVVRPSLITLCIPTIIPHFFFFSSFFFEKKTIPHVNEIFRYLVIYQTIESLLIVLIL